MKWEDMNNYTIYEVWYNDEKTSGNPSPNYTWYAAFCGETLVLFREFHSKAAAWDWIMDISIEL